MSYCSSSEVWKNLGKDSYTKIRNETIGTSSGTSSTNYDLDHDNAVSASVIVYTNSSSLTSSAYSLNLDDGKIIGLTGAGSGSVITADYDYGDLPDSMIQQMISSSDSLIDIETGRTFGLTTGSIEYLDVEEGQRTFFTKNYPIITLSSIARNIAVQTATPNWETLSAGYGEDYITNSNDYLVGKIRFIDNYPYDGMDMLKAVYNYGYASTPNLVKELSILLTIRQMANSSVYKSIFKGHDNFTPVRLQEIEIRIEELKRILKKQSIELV